MATQNIDLAGIFSQVSQTLAQNQKALDEADTGNHDHGTNMVKTFSTIASALEEKQGSSASTALKYAAKQLAKTATSGSGKQYAENLAVAATQVKGKEVDTKGAMSLLQTLIGGGAAQQVSQSYQQAAPPSQQQSSGSDLLGSLISGMTGSQVPSGGSTGSEDLLGSLLGGLAGSAAPQQQQSAPSGGGASSGDLLGSLLGGLTGGSSGGGNSGLQDGIGVDDLLSAGMAYLSAKQSGGSNTQALLQAFLAGSGMGNANYRQASTTLVVNTFLNALGGMAK